MFLEQFVVLLKPYRRILLSLLLAFNFVLIVSLTQTNAFSRPPISVSDSFQCSDLVPMLQWSIAHHGLGNVHLSSKNFADRSAVVFAEKLDPERLLFLDSEVEELKSLLGKNWERVITQRNCSSVMTWFQKWNLQARKRILEKTKDVIASGVLTLKPDSKRTLKKKDFSKTIDELKKRQESFLVQVFFDTPATIRKAYESNLFLFFQERLDLIVFPENQGPLTLFAKALLGTLDPYSTYFSKKEFSEFYEELSGLSAGVGISVEKSPESLGVTEVVRKSPADQAGIKIGERIVEVDGTPLAGLNFKSCTQLLKGSEGSLLTLTLENQKGRREVKLKRSASVFKEKKVSSKQVVTENQKTITLISIPSFYGRGGMEGLNEGFSSSEDLKKHLIKSVTEKTDGIVLDLRGNPGGYLEEAVTMAGYFLGEKIVVGVKDRAETKTLHSLGTMEPIYQGPLVVWVDEETASAAEVLAAALKDYQRAVLVGSKATFGKGSVQKLFQMDDPFLDMKLEGPGGVIKLTTSLFFSPMGHSPGNGGVKTHITLGLEKSDGIETGKATSSSQIEEIAPLVVPSVLDTLKRQEPIFLEKIAQIKTSPEASTNELEQVVAVTEQALVLMTN